MVMTIEQSIDKHGARHTAKLLINAQIKRLTSGMVTLYELPDTPEISGLIDELEGVLNADLIDKHSIKDILDMISEDLLIESIMD
jgi:uncharacterized protein YlaN (UPF0358 family)